MLLTLARYNARTVRTLARTRRHTVLGQSVQHRANAARRTRASPPNVHVKIAQATPNLHRAHSG